MRIVPMADVVVPEVQYSQFRKGGIQLTRILEGEMGSPSNYVFDLARFERYYTPRHTHNYEQVRYCLKGEYPVTMSKVIPQGWISYHPEGTYYGPQDVDTTLAEGPAVLTVQCGGPSGQGFRTGRQTREAIAAMVAEGKGRFEDGAYITIGDDGTERVQDGYEAMWEATNGRPLVYPPQKYDDIILMNPEAFAWVPRADEPGVDERILGAFGEGQIRIGFYRLAPGATHTFPTRPVPTVLWSQSGTVEIDGQQFPPETSVALDGGDAALAVTAVDEAVLYFVELPVPVGAMAAVG